MHGEYRDYGEIGLAGRARSAARGESEGADGPGSLVIVTVEDGDPEFAKAIEEQLSVVTSWWHGGPAPGQGFVQTVLRAPEERHDVERFLHTSGIREAGEDEPLVVYITSHGAVGTSGRHFLLLPETDRDRLLATGMPTNDVVVAALDSRARHVLVIVNTCEAEGVDVELRALARDLARGRTADGTLNVVATTANRSPVLGREFALVLRGAFEWLQEAAGITRPHLSISEFVQALEQATERLNADRGMSLPGPRPVLQARLSAPAPTLPNPGYRPQPQVVTEAREEVAATHEELEYWLDRASGRASDDDPGWYFSGRQELNRQLARFVEGPAGVQIVTGTAASGKSAVLGRVVTLSDPVFRASPRYAEAVRRSPAESVPDEGAVQVAVSARNRGPLSLIEAIGSRLGCEQDRSRPAADALRQWQEGLRRFFTTTPRQADAYTDSCTDAYADSCTEAYADSCTDVDSETDRDGDPTTYPGPYPDTYAGPYPRPHPGEDGAGDADTVTVTVVVDSLDESTDPAACIRDVLAPLAAYAGEPAGAGPGAIPAQGAGPAPAAPAEQTARRGLRLLLGVRSSSPGDPESTVAARPGELLAELQLAFPRARVVRTDGDGVQADIAAYVTALLAGAPWGADPATAELAAQRVAPRVGRSFLDARLAAEQLRRSGGSALLDDPSWLAQLDRGTVGLFEQDLDHVTDEGLNRDEAVALLRATAFGLGRGIPWAQIWPAVAEGLLEAPIDHADEKIRRLLGSRLAGYLTHDSEDDRVVYRPAHEQLAAMLRRWPQRPYEVGEPTDESG
ncbi:hypothetical protein AB0M39_05600 [Streptomyces sp. NPDC051907]|uniref:hypothetical protein n=1 Tax=Streptomyces sp. NPDC051907 TaxID=3155284 RepID=UPI003427B2B5